MSESGCPKCGAMREPAATDCKKCGIIFEKYLARQASAANPAATSPNRPAPPRHPQSTDNFKPNDTQELQSAVGSKAYEKALDWAKQNPSKVSHVGVLLLGLIVGFFGGREYLKYEIRSSIEDVKDNLKNVFSGEKQEEAPAKKGLLSKILPKQADPISVKLLQKGFRDADYGASPIIRAANTFTVAFTNTTDQDIRAFEGRLAFSDLLDNEIFSANAPIKDPVARGQTLQWEGEMQFNDFKDGHNKLRRESLENIKVAFNTSKILFADGTTKTYGE